MTTPSNPNYKCADEKCCPYFAPPHAHLEPTSETPSKPRRWWLTGFHVSQAVDKLRQEIRIAISHSEGLTIGGDKIEVVEASALDAAEKEIERLKKDVSSYRSVVQSLKEDHFTEVVQKTRAERERDALRAEVAALKAKLKIAIKAFDYYSRIYPESNLYCYTKRAKEALALLRADEVRGE